MTPSPPGEARDAFQPLPVTLVVGAAGASGSIYAKRILELASGRVAALHAIASQAALRVFRHELGHPARGSEEDIRSWLDLPDEQRLAIVRHANDDIGAAPASGSFGADALIIAPCSMKTLAAVAHGFADTLIARAADVALKERRRLVLVPRETPLSAIHLENMLKLARLGAAILPACPPFYHRPRTILDVVDSIARRALELAGIPLPGSFRWMGEEG